MFIVFSVTRLKDEENFMVDIRKTYFFFKCHRGD